MILYGFPNEQPEAEPGSIAVTLTCHGVDRLPNCSSPTAAWHPTSGADLVSVDHFPKFLSDRCRLVRRQARAPESELIGMGNVSDLPSFSFAANGIECHACCFSLPVMVTRIAPMAAGLKKITTNVPRKIAPAIAYPISMMPGSSPLALKQTAPRAMESKANKPPSHPSHRA